mmetsp:Transcript_42466/g.128862  ORF Transcript_42466/g.128862 Transcript_42466/m.128862 type:complete len:139 (-) Transcript_42466:322-738(-)|eukprot:CAMPEP_0113560398 /NCGR_PEP_ID=MMETSP0015_2-20120614/19409_1 /TAXON_ID=2838 /ORGANISM="Odontella" /LENGTH=138 /DNA_ID=CAMNT_0000462099 /DNA_START=171 /DNA_END=587 /DNA_ORIENTATION=+ /assembly_acc=CAM_ASM_000160
MSASSRRNEQSNLYLRQATILRKNLYEWDRMLHSPRGEDWPSMLGRLNAALNQAGNLDAGIEDVMEHFVYVPKKCTANAQDIPFFLSTRLADAAQSDSVDTVADGVPGRDGDPVKILREYESRAAGIASEYEEKMVRF